MKNMSIRPLRTTKVTVAGIVICYIVISEHFLESKAQSEKCMQGFSKLNSINSSTVSHNTHHGSFLYPTLRFTCGGILRGFRIPLLRTDTSSRLDDESSQRKLSLKVGIWRQTPTVWHEVDSIEIEHYSIREHWMDPENYSIAIIKRTKFPIHKNDIVSFKIDDDEQFPFLKRTEVTDRHMFGIPIISADFTPSPRPVVTPTKVDTTSRLNSITVKYERCKPTPTGHSDGLTITFGGLLTVLLLLLVTILISIVILAIAKNQKRNSYAAAQQKQSNGEEPCTVLQSEYEVPSNPTYMMVLKSNEIYETLPGEECTSTVPNEYETFRPLCHTSQECRYWCPGNTVAVIYQQMDNYSKISKEQISTEHQLGEGEFGVVYKGKWTPESGNTRTVALKTLKSTASNDERVKLLQEAAIMGQFSHPHIAKLHGVVKDVKTPILVMEFLPKGDLREHLLKLKENRSQLASNISTTLLTFCQEIADGMMYLSRKDFIHRDLAARNILLTADTYCKIADFGMSHDLQENNYYKTKGGRIPVKWTAPEAIFYKKYTTKSDVWSYGMVMYEIWSLGRKPFEDLTGQDVIHKLNMNYKQPPPPGCPRGIYAIMVECWAPDPNKRAAFDNIFHRLSSSTDTLLKWNDTDNTGSHLCSVLGAPIEHGIDLYKDLQE